MLKYAFVALSSLFALQIMNADGVIIEDNTPSTLAAGGSQDVTITINKGNVEGFAKLELELPIGLRAESVATSGASFTFAGQKAKFIWMAVPEEEEFSVTYKLMADPTASGNLMITGVFAYIKDQQRVDYALNNRMVSIGLAGDEIVEEPAVDEPMETETADSMDSGSDDMEPQEASGTEDPMMSDSNDPNEMDGAMDSSTADSMPETTAYEGSDMQCLRYITEDSPTSYTVRLQVVNNALEGFCKITETVPAGCTAEELDSDGAVVTLEPNGIKYVWFDAPSSDAFEVTYRIRRFAAGAVPQVTGVFAYVKNNAPFEQPVMFMGASSQDVVADNTPPDTGASTSTPDPDPVIEPEERPVDTGSTMDMGDPGSATDTAMGTDRDPMTDTSTQADSGQSGITSFPDPEVGITYKVQIAAAHRTVGKSYFSSRHDFNEGFNIENHSGWVKYTTGSHEVYKQARDDRNRIRSQYPSFKGPFVTAYSDGQRITVQEALMISNQQWYK